MKKLFTFWLAISTSIGLMAQTGHQESGVIVASGFHITRPLSEIFAENPVDEAIYIKKESEDRKHRKATKFKFGPEDGAQYGNDPASMQTKGGDVPSLGVKASWAGQTASGFRPFDPSGAVGPNHYVQMINSTTFKIYNKSTGAVQLTGSLGNLWSPATANNGDPIVMYDKAADRWFLAQFGSSTDNKIYIAVSATPDPTGSYYTYTYVSPQFPDYLKFSVWQDGYYMTSNQTTQKVFCFERTAMLAGTPGARSVYVNYTPPKSGFFVPLPACAADGTLPPAGTPCPIMSYEDNGWGTGFVDRVNIYNMNVNWSTTTPTATITLASQLPCAAFDGSYASNWNDVSQPGTTQKLDGIGGAMMYRAQWKTWSGYNSVLLSWAVQISTTQRSIKWVEMRQNQTTGAWSIYQEGIYTPDTNTRWMSSIAMDNNGSIGLSYLKSNSTSIYPGLYYTGRRSCDPLGTLPVTESTVIAGTGSQTGVNRVGDYAHTCLDPDGVTFWSTSEYMGGATGSSAATTRVFSFQIAPCNLTAALSILVTGGTNPTCSGAAITFSAAPTNGGSAPVYQWKVNGVNAGTNSSIFTLSAPVAGDVVSCVMTSNLANVLGSPATSNSITVAATTPTAPEVSIAVTSGSNPTCAGSSMTFTATPTNGGSAPAYQWKVNGVNAGTNSAAFTTTTLTAGSVVSCVMTSSSSCATSALATSNSITISVNASIVPTISIAQTAGTNPSASGASVTFTATITNGGSTPVYNWQVNGVSAGVTTATYTTTALTNNAIVTCVLTSNATCATPATLTSNSITMTITGGTTTYCAASTTNITTTEYIKKVVCGTIANTSARSSYSNFSNLSTTVVRGTARSITITLGAGFSTDKVSIYVDWNNNGTFTESNENVYNSPAGVGPFTASFTPPAAAVSGAVRMRIRLTDAGVTGANNAPCGVSSYGEVEDYTLNVSAVGVMIDGGVSRVDAEAQRSEESSVLPAELLSVYPNPNNGSFTVKAMHEGTYYLMNEAGQLVKSFTVNADNNFTYQIEYLTSGFYILSGQNKQGISKQKIVVTN